MLRLDKYFLAILALNESATRVILIVPAEQSHHPMVFKLGKWEEVLVVYFKFGSFIFSSTWERGLLLLLISHFL
jgi:hypothetical protein